jgi:hypothetical protein
MKFIGDFFMEGLLIDAMLGCFDGYILRIMTDFYLNNNVVLKLNMHHLLEVKELSSTLRLHRNFHLSDMERGTHILKGLP